MGKAVINKHIDSSSELSDKLFLVDKELAKGEIIICNDADDPALYITTGGDNPEVKRTDFGVHKRVDDLTDVVNENITTLEGLVTRVTSIEDTQIDVDTIQSIASEEVLKFVGNEDELPENYKTLEDVAKAVANGEAGIYDDTLLWEAVNRNTEALSVLTGDDVDLSMREIAKEEVSVFVGDEANLPEQYNTLEKVANAVKNGEGGTYTSIYNPGIADTDLEMTKDYGDFKAGTTVGELSGKTYDDLFDGILFPTVYPVLVAPSAVLKLDSYSTLAEVGSSAPGVANFVGTFNRGSITLNGVYQNPRAGELTKEVIYDTSQGEDYALPIIVSEGSMSYTYKAYYDEGPQPKTNKGADYVTPLSAGSVLSNPVIIRGVYPWFATTNGATEVEPIKQALKTTGSSTSEFTLLATAVCKQLIQTPSQITKIQVKDVVSGNFITVSLDAYVMTTITKDINGIEKDYYQYLYNGDARGQITLKITF